MKKLIPFVIGRYLEFLSLVAPRMAGRHGFRFFCFPFRVPLRKYHKDFLFPARNTVMKHGDLNIQVYKWGNGDKKILFLHGWQSHSYRWKNFIHSFSPDEYTLYAIDAPGHGLSSGNFLNVPAYSSVIEKLIDETGGLEGIISHSLGAFTTLYTLHRLHDFPVKKIVLLAPPGEATEFIRFYQQTLRLKDHSVKHILEHFETVIGAPVTFFSAPKFAEAVTQHGLIIHDENDEETPHHHSSAIHKAWKNSSLIITTGLGHNLKSPSIIEEVVGFIKQDHSKFIPVP